MKDCYVNGKVKVTMFCSTCHARAWRYHIERGLLNECRYSFFIIFRQGNCFSTCFSNRNKI